MPSVRIDNDAVLAAAGALVDRGGIHALSLSRVAEALRVRPSALYTYVQNVDHLHHTLAVHATSTLTARLRTAAIGVAGEGAVRAMADAYRLFALECPGQFAAMLSPPPADDDADLAVATADLNAVLCLGLRGMGFTDDAADDAAASFRATLHGFVTLEAGRAEHLDGATFPMVIEILVQGLRASAA